MILLKTAESNGGLCGQCARNPELARSRQKRKEKLEALGPPTFEAVHRHIVEFIGEAAEEASVRFSHEGICAFVLCSDPQFECVIPRAMTEEWVQKQPAGSRWGGQGWYEQAYMLREAEFELLSEWGKGLETGNAQSRGDLLLSCYLAGLRNVRRRECLPPSTCLLIVSSGMGQEEIYALAEIVNTKTVLQDLSDSLSLHSEAVASMRRIYAKLLASS
jgi:hypothetical protein